MTTDERHTEVAAAALVHCLGPAQLVLVHQVLRRHLAWAAQPADDYRSSCRLGDK
jgi:hypothetical protein